MEEIFVYLTKTRASDNILCKEVIAVMKIKKVLAHPEHPIQA